MTESAVVLECKYTEKQLVFAAAKRQLISFTVDGSTREGKIIGYQPRSGTVLLSVYGRHVRIKSGSVLEIIG